MIIAGYHAFWLTNFMATSPNSLWEFLTVLPGLLSIFNFQYCVKSAALLKAMCVLDEDAMLLVIEQMLL